ncbi:MAG: TetR/AcrR family transcriptional regulator [Rhodopila sp.]|nr:TetR/AcrR family transcriptional regulator [Rhodopila sp.]
MLSNEDRRRVLIDAAETVFVRRGYHTATMDDVAHEAGMSKKTLYQIFPAKVALFEALIGERLSFMVQPMTDDGADPVAAVIKFMTDMATAVLSPGLLAITRLMIADASRSPEIGSALQRQLSFNSLEQWLGRQNASGKLKVGDPYEAAGMLYGIVMGDLTIRLLLSIETLPTPEQIRSRVERATRIFLKGVRAF